MNKHECDCAKSCIVCIKTEFNFIAAAYRHTQYLSIPSVSSVKFNWYAFLKGIFATLQSHSWYNGTHRGHQFGSGDIGLLHWLCSRLHDVLLATVWASWLLIRCPKQKILPPPIPPIPPHSTPPHTAAHPTHPLY